MIKIQNISNTTNACSIKKTSNNKTQNSVFNFNGEIESTKQADGQIDCWLLSGINALNTTKWGKKAIKDAIKPDEMGGVYITLKGAPTKQKVFHVSIEDMQKADNSKQYSTGDPDMLAIELAVEKLYKIMDKQKLGEIDRLGADTNSYLGNMIVDNGSRMLSVEKLLTNTEEKVIVNNLHGPNPWEGIDNKDFEKTYKYLADNKDSISITATFSARGDAFGYREKDDPVHGMHSYCVKKIVYGKYVILSDPYDSGKDIKISWEHFTTDECLVLFCSTENAEADAKLENALPKNYRTSEKLRAEQVEQRKAKEEQERIDEENRAKKELLELEQKRNWDNIIQIFGEDGKKKLVDWNPSTPPINKHNVMNFFKKYGTEIIAKVDQDVRGWGNGDAKKTYIIPMIESLAELAKEKGIEQSKIDSFKKICIDQELDAWFYTNEKVIVNEVNNMLKLLTE